MPLLRAHVFGLLIPWAVVIGWSYFAAAKRLRGLDLPEPYLKQFHLARFVSYGGLGLFVVLLAVALRARG